MNRGLSVTLQVAVPLAACLLWATEQPYLPPGELVRRAAANDAKTGNQTTKFMFRDRKETPAGSQTKIMVQTRDAMAGMVVAINDQPLSEEQRRGEFWRVQRFLKYPAELEKKRKQEKENEERVQRILSAMPDAFLYEYDGNEPAPPGVGKPGSKLVRLRFRPNPRYDPPSRVEQVLTGMQGAVLLDPQNPHIARIDGTLVKDVSFGWGILGRLDRGGRFHVDQTEVGQGDWVITRMELDFTGKLLLFKSLSFKSTEVYSDFRPVPSNLTFAEGLQLLRKEIPPPGSSSQQTHSSN